VKAAARRIEPPEIAHALGVAGLPPIHRDPFDAC
jgi:PIN domain nuclease of toxin-antitoxin system